MNAERILSLDVSGKTGWASILSTENGIVLEEHGILPQIHEPVGPYPGNYVDWSNLVFDGILTLINKHTPKVLVIEETCAGSKNVYSQKFLEFCHYNLANFIKNSGIESVYLLTGAWRSEVGCKMTKEESKHNVAVKDYKDKNNTKVAKGADGKRIGKLTKKHINIRRANELFGKFLKEPLRKKDEDEADALLLAAAYHFRRVKRENKDKI